MGSDGVVAGGVNERGRFIGPFLAIRRDVDVGKGGHVTGGQSAAAFLRWFVCERVELV